MPESTWAASLLDQIDALFLTWHRRRDGASDRAGLQTALLPIHQALGDALRAGQRKRWHKIVTLSNDLLAHWDALWAFARVEGVEPTNNAAERVLRPAVIWRKQCFGTQSAEGSRFVERILSVVTLGRQQKRNVWSFLQRLMLPSLTANVFTTSLRAIPRSSALSTRCRKSIEYAFMPAVYHKINNSALCYRWISVLSHGTQTLLAAIFWRSNVYWRCELIRSCLYSLRSATWTSVPQLRSNTAL